MGVCCLSAEDLVEVAGPASNTLGCKLLVLGEGKFEEVRWVGAGEGREREREGGREGA